MNNQEIIGKQQLFLSWYGPVSGRLSRFILSLVWDKEEAKDIASETVLIAFKKFDNVQSEQVFMYYLFSIASRLIKQANRRKKLWGIFSNETEKHPEPMAYISEWGLDMEVLHKALDRLNPKEKEAIMLFEISGFSLAEIKEIQKDSLSAVKSRLSRSRTKLSKMLQEKGTTRFLKKTEDGFEHSNILSTANDPLNQGIL